MRRHQVWQYVEALSGALAGGGVDHEAVLSELEQELLAVPKPELTEVRRRMILIVASLSRLEVRLMDTDGPHGASV